MIMENKYNSRKIELINIKNEYDKFLNNHKKYKINFKGNQLEYYSCGM